MRGGRKYLNEINTEATAMIARPRRIQNNPTRGSEKHVSLHHPPVYSISSLSLSDSPSRSPPTPLLLLLTSRGLSWTDCQSVPDSDSARSIKQFISNFSEDHVKTHQKDRLLSLSINSISINQIMPIAIKFPYRDISHVPKKFPRWALFKISRYVRFYTRIANSKGTSRNWKSSGRRRREKGSKIGREEEEVSVVVSSSIVPGTCAYSVPRAFGRRRVHRRKEQRRRQEEKEKRLKQKVTAVCFEPSSGTLTKRARIADACRTTWLSRDIFNPFLNVFDYYHCPPCGI